MVFTFYTNMVIAAIKSIVVSALAEISAAVGTGCHVVSFVAGKVSAGKDAVVSASADKVPAARPVAVVTLALVTATSGARLVITAFTTSVAARELFMSLIAEEAVTFFATGVLAFLAGEVSAVQIFFVTLPAEEAVTVRTIAVEIIGTAGVVAAIHQRVVAFAQGAAAMGAIFTRGLICRANVGEKDVDVFGIATGYVSQITRDRIFFPAFKGFTVRNQRNHSTFKAVDGHVQVIAADGNGGGKADVGALGEGLKLAFKKFFICLGFCGMVHSALADAFNGLYGFQFNDIGIADGRTDHLCLVAHCQAVFSFGIDVEIAAVIGKQKAGGGGGADIARDTVGRVQLSRQHLCNGGI